jgi:hypothetical protein
VAGQRHDAVRHQHGVICARRRDEVGLDPAAGAERLVGRAIGVELREAEAVALASRR